MSETKGLDEIRSFLDRKRNYVLSRLKNLEIIEEEQIMHLTLPCENAPGKNDFSKENLESFKREVISSNHIMDKLVGIALNEYIEHNVEYGGRGIENIIDDKLCFDKHKVPFDFIKLTKPTRITWETYALPNFLDSPQLGKKVHFNFLVRGEEESVFKSSIEFRTNYRRRENGSDVFEPIYLIKDTGSETFSKEVLSFLENSVSKEGYAIKYKHIR